MYLRSKEIAIRKALIQAEAQIMFQLGDKATSIDEKGRGTVTSIAGRHFDWCR